MVVRPRLFYGWVVVAAAALGLFFSGAPIVVFSFSVFIKPLAQAFHAGRGPISLAFTIHNFIGAASAPLIGRVVDRYGARKVVIPGLIFLALVLISALMIGSRLWQLYVFFLALGPITAMTTPIPFFSVISRWFDRRRGLALGTIMFGMGVGAVVMPPVVQHLVTSFGWRMGYAGVGFTILAIPIVVVARFLKNDPSELGLLPDGEHFESAGDATSQGLSWPEVWRTRTFWLLISAFVLAGGSVHACVLHMAALLNDRGLSTQNAALGSSIVGIAIMIARLASGYFQDRFFAPRVAVGVFLLAALGMALLWTGRGGPVALTAAFLVGIGMGAETDIIGFLVTRYFGLRAFGATFGFAFGSFVLAGGFGALLMGAGFDRSGSYRVPLVGCLVATLFAVALFTRLGPYCYAVIRKRSQRSERATA